jgi:4-amino-4-deoxy-L-arabinose transferase-like glycosyltransferase
VIGTISVLFAYLIGRRLADPAAGLIGAAAVAVYPALLEYQGMLMGEPLAAALLSAAVLAMLWARDNPAASVWVLPGTLLGALALTRPEYLGVAILLGLVVLATGPRDEWRQSLARAAIMLAGVALVVAPWTIHNAVALERFVPISTGGGQVLFAGTYLPSDGDPEKVGREVLERHPGLTRRLAADHLPPGTSPSVGAVLARVRLEQILAALAEQRYPELEADRALTRMGRERLWDDVTEQPLDYAGFVGAKVVRIWAHGPRDVMRRTGWEVFHLALVGLGLLGLVVLARRRRWEAIPLATIFIAITAICAVLVASPRRVLVMLPLVAALAGAGAVWAWGQAAQRRSARVRG